MRTGSVMPRRSSSCTQSGICFDVDTSNADNSSLAKDGHPMAGNHNGLWYLRDSNDNFRLYVGGRAQIDTYLGAPD